MLRAQLLYNGEDAWSEIRGWRYTATLNGRQILTSAYGGPILVPWRILDGTTIVAASHGCPECELPLSASDIRADVESCERCTEDEG